ncbi:MAG TPA: type IV toxin-antitoxin system AbiEi family antitoxin domain-containing protein [Solirubrobacteraceae bacterium]|nr:type IV toxin-antitoxin system AbiEi family antitoxin domain-containing protein [Solirubrobacteraceae bacterium]
MRDARVAQLAGRQFNRISREQLAALGLSRHAIAHRVGTGRLVIVEQGVFAIAPVLPYDDWGRWMGATLTSPGSALSHASAAAARGVWSLPREFEIVTRPGRGGPRRHGSVLVHRSTTLGADVEDLRGIPVTSVPRTLLDLASCTSASALARALREAIRLRCTSLEELGEHLGRARGRRGTRRLGDALARYSGLPLHRARSGAEVRALEVLRDAGRPVPGLNVRIAGAEADLSWPAQRLIVEIDGGPFHLDVGEDQRKQALWESAGWRVRRLESGSVYDEPWRLLALAPAPSVPHGPA